MKCYAVVGHPLSHSLSPVVFNAGFKALELDCIYTKEDVDLSELKSLIEKVRSGEYSGLSITVPYKEEVIKYIDELTPEAKTIGAVNTIYFSNGKVKGENTDWQGCKEVLVTHTDLKNKKILIYGAGGAARACLYALKECKDNIFLTNRTEEKGKKLADEFEVMFTDRNNLPNVDIFINATSASLNTKNELLVSKNWLKKVSTVFDLMYGSTSLTEDSKELGIKTIDAREMLLCQAGIQFKIFTGKEAPLEVMAESIGI